MNTLTEEDINIDDLEELSDYDLHERFDEMLDEIYPDCKIAGLSYSTSRALKEIDPVAYRCGFSDWLDNEISVDSIIFIEHNNKYYLPE